ncbi:response regulator [Paraglaciecola psychrophila]|uniref:Response regulator receiver n=1 Tax=Paraglaciecola psychrophila 170 TaxID=1129794 RepID=M4RU50_9ALTE|nr:response regulator [Paraglaciecola psychrophila]AGH46188.1 response regulator receiver [Paraglaciecola psychrophila 170]
MEVLIIDGQALVHSVVRGALLDAGIEKVQSAHNAYSALRLCQVTRFDMILIAFDVKSDKDGFNLLEEMKFKGYITKTTCVVFLSTDTTQGLVNCVVEMEPTDFWVKPLDRSKVEKRIHQIITIEKSFILCAIVLTKASTQLLFITQSASYNMPRCHYIIHKLID